MLIKKYCFAKECYLGQMIADTDTGKFIMKYNDDKDLTDYARRFKQTYPLDTDERITGFIEERVIPVERADRSSILSMCGIDIHASQLEIFLVCHCVSANDRFWINDTLDNSFWYTTLKDS